MRFVLLLVSLASLVVATSCASEKPAADRDTTPSGGSQSFAGLYRVTQHNEPARCTPQPLPPPASSTPGDTANYFSLSEARGDSNQFYVRETHDGSRMTAVVSMDSLQRDAAPPLTGTLNPDGSWSIDRTLQIGREGGPRKGGRRFFVEQAMNVRGTHELKPEGAGETAKGTTVYRFRADSAGAVVTTCTVEFTASGTRVAP